MRAFFQPDPKFDFVNKRATGFSSVFRMLPFLPHRVYYPRMKKLSALLLIIMVVFAISFATWQLFRGNLEAAFSALPFLLVTYFLMKLHRK